MIEMTNLPFGVELELYGITPQEAANSIDETVDSIGNCGAQVVMRDGRIWRCFYDTGTETASPVLYLKDMELLQNIVRALRQAGGRSDRGCGVHVHVGVRDLTVEQLLSLSKMTSNVEESLYRGVRTYDSRRSQWCGPIHSQFFSNILERNMSSLADLEREWQRVHHGRYYGLNMQSVFYRSTVEFRYFNSSVHAGRVKAYVNLCLGLVSRATANEPWENYVREPANEELWRSFLTNELGFEGQNFRSTMLHLTRGF